jgi:hypothetical protein
MPVDYVAPDPAAADLVYRAEREAERFRRRLAGAPADRLRAVARDRGEPAAARAEALLGLIRARDPDLPDILVGLLDEANPALWRLAVKSCRDPDPRVVERLRRLLDHPAPEHWAEAAHALARLRDPAVRPRLAEWLRSGDRPHRHAAVQCLRAFDPAAARAELRAYWDDLAGDAEDRLVVAAALLGLGDGAGRALLEAAAAAAAGDWAVFAAFAVYGADPGRGLRLMRGILDRGDLAARQALVSQVWNVADLPHAFTADGVHEARPGSRRGWPKPDDGAGRLDRGSGKAAEPLTAPDRAGRP